MDRSEYTSIGTKASTGLPALAVVGLVLLLLYLTGRFLWQYNKGAAQEAAASASSSSSLRRPAVAADASTTTSLPLPAASPLPCRAVPVSSSSSSLLPVFFVLNVAVPGRGLECAVCLTEFREREAGRILPRCGHAFHEQCIATWLRVRSSCPLCRAPVATK